MTTRAELVAIIDLTERLQLVLDRDDEYPMRMLGEQLRDELLRLHDAFVEPGLGNGSFLDPAVCGSEDLRTRTRCLIDAAHGWTAAARRR